MLHVEHGRQVAVLQFHRLEEVVGLLLSRRVYAVEMIGSTSETVLACLVEILTEVLVCLCGSLSSLDHDKSYGALVDLSVVLEFVPVDASLMV